jgi:putative DNA primase/helicase
MNLPEDYVRHGLALVQIPVGQKGPVTPGWNKRQNAITDPERARALTGNVGLAHAYSSPPTMALDIDDLPRARAWLAERAGNLDALLDADEAVQISSGRPGRAKLIYRLPEGMAPIPTKQITDPDTGEVILEFRCATANGRTAQDVLPPSIHPQTGKPYEWAGKGNWRSIPSLPEALLSAWQRLGQSSVAKASASEAPAQHGAVITLPPETIQHLRSALFSMRADDYGLWIKVGLALKPLGDVGRGLWLEWSQTSEKSEHDQ